MNFAMQILHGWFDEIGYCCDAAKAYVWSVEGEMVKVPFKVEPGHDAKPRPGVNYDKISELISIAEGDSHK